MDLIIGEGITGSSIKSYLSKLNKEYKVWAESKGSLESDLEIMAKDAEHIYISPGCRINEPPYSLLDKSKIKTDIEVFLKEKKIKNVIAITGTNGKSSLVNLLVHALRKLGFNSFGLGNNEVPPLNLINEIENDDWVIFELSSFQLSWMQDFFPFKVAAITSFTPDHLNWHLDLDDYKKSKEKIFKKSIVNFAPYSFQTKENHYSWPSTYLEVIKEASESELDFLLNKSFAKGPMLICLYQALKILAELNFKEKDIFDALADWRPEPYKYEVMSKFGVNWINDSKATNIDAALAAFDCLDEDKKTIAILGGLSKGQDLSRLKLIDKKASLIFAIGSCAKEIKDIFGEKAFHVETIEKCFEEMINIKNIDVVILSPACASLDQFKGYKHRGEVFKKLVNDFKGFAHE